MAVPIWYLCKWVPGVTPTQPPSLFSKVEVSRASHPQIGYLLLSPYTLDSGHVLCRAWFDRVSLTNKTLHMQLLYARKTKGTPTRRHARVLSAKLASSNGTLAQKPVGTSTVATQTCRIAALRTQLTFICSHGITMDGFIVYEQAEIGDCPWSDEQQRTDTALSATLLDKLCTLL